MPPQMMPVVLASFRRRSASARARNTLGSSSPGSSLTGVSGSSAGFWTRRPAQSGSVRRARSAPKALRTDPGLLRCAPSSARRRGAAHDTTSRADLGVVDEIAASALWAGQYHGRGSDAPRSYTRSPILPAMSINPTTHPCASMTSRMATPVPVVRFEGVSMRYGRGPETLRDLKLHPTPRVFPFPHRPVGRGQKLAAEADLPGPPCVTGPRGAVRPRRQPDPARGPAVRAPPHRGGVPGLPPAGPPVGVRQRRPAGAHRRPQAGHATARTWPNCCSGWAWATACTPCPPPCPAARSSAWPSPAPWSTAPTCCWPTSPPAMSIRPCRCACCDCSSS